MSQPGVVISQPSQHVQMEMTTPSFPRLDYLAQLDQIIVRQKVELFEALTGFETRNKYRVLNKHDQEIFYVGEESDLFNRQMCGPNRGFIFHIHSMSPQGPQQEVMRLERPFQCCKGGCPACADGCCMYPIFVYDAAGQQLGMVRMMNNHCTPRFGVFDPSDKQLFEIQGTCCPCQCPCCPDDIELQVFNAGETTQIAKIAKKWGGCGREWITDADNLSLIFPLSMSITNKALLLAAVFLIDVSMFEKK